MKHIKNIIALSLFAAMTAGCEDYNLSQYKDVPPVPKEGEKIDMVFTSENSSFSRTNIYEGDKISWSKDDMISVFAKQVNSMFTIDNEDEENVVLSANFKGKALFDNSYFALYPFNVDAKISETQVNDNGLSTATISTVLSNVQKAVVGSFDNRLNPSVAIGKYLLEEIKYPLAMKLKFTNAASFIKINLNENIGSEVHKITLKGNNGELIAGNIDITVKEGAGTDGVISTEASTVINEEGAATEIMVLPANASTDIVKGYDYYVVIAPTTFKKGISIILEDEIGLKKFANITGEINLQSNQCYDIALSSENLEEEVAPESETVNITSIKAVEPQKLELKLDKEITKATEFDDKFFAAFSLDVKNKYEIPVMMPDIANIEYVDSKTLNLTLTDVVYADDVINIIYNLTGFHPGFKIGDKHVKIFTPENVPYEGYTETVITLDFEDGNVGFNAVSGNNNLPIDILSVENGALKIDMPDNSTDKMVNFTSIISYQLPSDAEFIFTFDAFRNKTENAPINDMSLRYASGIASEHGNGDIFKKWQGFNTLKTTPSTYTSVVSGHGGVFEFVEGTKVTKGVINNSGNSNISLNFKSKPGHVLYFDNITLKQRLYRPAQ